jgi:uncharacterized protein involved in exopolysaccharide biosynthesis
MAVKALPMLHLEPPVDDGVHPVIPSAFVQPGLSVAQITAIVAANRKISAIVAIVIIALAAVAIKLIPKSYDATATIMINYEVNDPLGGKEFPLNLLENYIATQIEIIKSREVLLPVTEQLQLVSNKDFTAGYNGLGSQADWAMEQLARRLTIAQGAGTQLVYIKAESKHADEAALIANAVVNVYLEVQQKRFNDPAALRAERYSQQLAELREKVAASQDKVTAFRQQTGLTNISTAADDAASVLLNSLEQKYQEAQSARRTAEIKQTSDRDVSSEVMGSLVIQGLKAQLSTQEAQMAEQRATLGAKHPKIIELQSHIDATKASLANEVRTFTHAASAELTGASKLEDKLRTAVESQREKVVAMRNQQDEGGKLLLELESAQTVYKRALEGYDQVSAAAVGHYSNISLLTTAQVPVRATKPNKIKLFLLGTFCAISMGVFGPFLFSLVIDRRIRCRDDFERDMAIPVLAEL